MEDNTYYVLNDHTLNTLMSGLINANATMTHQYVVPSGYVEGTVNDAEFVELLSKLKTLELVVLTAKKG